MKEFVRGQDESNLVEIDLNKVIARVISICRNKINNAVNSFDVNIPPKLPSKYPLSSLLLCVTKNQKLQKVKG